MGFVQRKGKQLLPTKDGINLAAVLPEALTSPALTAEWETRLSDFPCLSRAAAIFGVNAFFRSSKKRSFFHMTN